MYNFLFKRVDNSALIVFRIIFGLLIFLESVGAIFTGWVKRTLVDPEFTFTIIGFEWMQPLPGYGMYFYYVVMGIFGFMVMLGYRYRLSMFLFTVMWMVTYMVQKASYNNHYYLLILISAFMCLVPAHRCVSLDVRRKPELRDISMPNWCKWIFIIQMFIVYTYASVNKVYPDWLDASVMELFMMGKKDFPIVGELLQIKLVHYVLAYGGILFDGLVIPMLLFRPTRKLALIASVVFHMFNSIVFQVGIFPYMSLAFILFFYDASVVQGIFLRKKPLYEGDEVVIPKYAKPAIVVFTFYFIVQALLPLRHHLIEGNVLYTEEGHRLSWRMMLRAKSGIIQYKVVDKATGNSEIIDHEHMVSPKQRNLLATKPDVIWQFVQRLKRKYEVEGREIEVYALNSRLSVNGKPYIDFIDKEVDLAAVSWDTFKHSSWVLLR